MAKPQITYTLDTTRLNRILKNLPGKTEDNNRAIAFRIEGEAKVKAPVDTGALQNSIYTVCGDKDGYRAASTKVRERNPKAATNSLPKPSGHDAHVGPSVNYGFYQEFGTRRMSAQPYLVPAVRAVESSLVSQWGNIDE